ncbi:YdeI/OmpD-associated family protein [Tenacibaculum sp. 1_MG-2023]|uniref:YdeI/OmpD-associated family protein n=1 Tax=Tenacibaculum sp. 1_MG-2023 TaxID=3062653 RepID=UPI0026E30EC6|nr:YdeI/OmpD-associated family protein [Tenacibaculum sp. 1_MG-2023]MDO6675467.1 YdeI/OmpD-associated family protein [Tenacibaculum sp. 1_MG-2023]
MEKVDKYIGNIKKWQEETKLLRQICLDCGLEEDFKWMHPCYTFQGKNIVLIHGFKDFCALLFHKGALLKDTDGVLIQQTENVQSARQIRFAKPEEIIDLISTIKAYIFEAIEVEKAGLKVKTKKTSEFEMVDEFKEVLQENPDIQTVFEALTPGRQRGYLLYFSQAKQSKTRLSRIEKSIPKMIEGKGHNER